MGLDLEFLGGRGSRWRQSAGLDRQYPFDFNYFAQPVNLCPVQYRHLYKRTFEGCR